MRFLIYQIRTIAAVFGVLVSLCSAQPIWAQADVQQNNYYSLGLAAYIDQDYALARTHWQRAARHKNARAMFNLGLLHERGNLADASSDKADEWFKLASQHGYVAADFHLGLRWLAQGGRDAQAKARIEKAAQRGYLPAQKRLGLTPTPISSSPTRSRPYLRESWIQTKPANHWTIQLLAYREKLRVEKFIDEHKLGDQAAYFKEKAADGTWFKLVYGVYDSKDKAEFARQNLPLALTEFGPWLRQISSVQKVINNQ